MAHIGSKAKGQFGYIKSITYTVNEQGDWDALTQDQEYLILLYHIRFYIRKPPQIYDTCLWSKQMSRYDTVKR